MTLSEFMATTHLPRETARRRLTFWRALGVEGVTLRSRRGARGRGRGQVYELAADLVVRMRRGDLPMPRTRVRRASR